MSDLFDEASNAWDQGDLTRALELFEMIDEDGNHVSALNAGYFYDEGLGVEANKEKAMFWYKKALRSDDVAAMNNIGILYKEKGNRRRAKYWFEKSIASSDIGSALELAKLCLELPTKSNVERARILLEQVLEAKTRIEVKEDSQEIAQKLLDKYDISKS